MYLENAHCISIARFDKSFCNNIITLAEKNALALAELDSKLGNKKIRNSKVVFLNDDNLNQTLRTVLDEHNKGAKWNFNIKEFEPLQYTVYNVDDHYDWHIDSHPYVYPNGMIRKLSFTLCLNEDYEGGEFEISNPNPNPLKHINTKFKDKFTTGTLISFPSFVWHKVNPVTFGTRKVLVGWAVGSQFV
jgi:PKHD-type hydroxylase